MTPTTPTAAPGVAVETTIQRLMSLAADWKRLPGMTGESVDAQDALREALRTALLAGAAEVEPVVVDQLKRLSILNAFMVELDSRMRMRESHGDGTISTKTIRDWLDQLFKAAPPAPVRAPQGPVTDAMPEIEEAIKFYGDIQYERGLGEVPGSFAESQRRLKRALECVEKRLAVSRGVTGALPASLGEGELLTMAVDAGLFPNSINRFYPALKRYTEAVLAATPASAVPVEVLTHTGDNDVSTATLLDESATMLEDYALHQRDLGYDSTAAGADAHAYRLRHLNVALPSSGGVQGDAAREAWRFNGDRASASAITTWANSFPELDEGEPNASYITTDGSDVVTDLLLAVDDDDVPVRVGDYVAREDGKFCILRAAISSNQAGAQVKTGGE